MKNKLKAAAPIAALALVAGASGSASAQQAPWTANGTLAQGDSRTAEGQFYDDHRVRLRAGQRLRITASGTVPEMDTMLILYPGTGATGEPLGMDDDSGGALNPRLFFTPPQDGEYLLRVQGYSDNDLGAYTVRVEELPPAPPPVTAHSNTVTTTGTWRIFQGELTDGDPESGGNRYDEYRITLAEGAHALIQLDAEAFDPVVQIRPADGDPDAEPLQVDDDGGPGLNSLMLFDAYQAGDYIVRVTSFSSEGRGAYRLSITP